jgi:hypothetical protein
MGRGVGLRMLRLSIKTQIMKYGMLLVWSVLLFACCKTLKFPPTKEKTQQLTTHQKTIDAAKNQVKSSWVDLVHSSLGWEWYYEHYNEKISESDIPSMSMVAVPFYRIDSIPFYTCNTDADIVNNLTIESNQAVFLVKKDTAFVVAIESKCFGTKWDGGNCSGIFSGIAQKCYQLYTKGMPFYNLHVYCYRTNDPPVWIFYNNGKRLISIQSDGSEMPLIEELNKKRESLQRWYKLHKK